MKKIRYLGPADQVNVAPYGPHRRGEVKDYPDDFAMHLIRTSHRQHFEIAQDSIEERPDNAEPGEQINGDTLDGDKLEPALEITKEEKKTAPIKKPPVRKHTKKGKR